MGCGLVGCLGLLGTSAVVGLAMMGSKQSKSINGPSNTPRYDRKPYGDPDNNNPSIASGNTPDNGLTPSTNSPLTSPDDDDEREDEEEGNSSGTGTGRASIEDSLLKAQVGDYQLSTKENVTTDYSAVATDAMKCVYRSSAGAEITHLIIRCKDASTSVAVLASTQTELERRGYQVTDSNTVRNTSGNELGKRAFLLGRNRTVLWTNHATFCMAAGPEGETQAFEKATSY